ncbi:helicase [Microbacterium sp. SLBN-111]|uniref:helicase n=1 Tax=Microbacterium sp. SLBN-111 TaxID=3377733 RepID=UPI003C77CBFA
MQLEFDQRHATSEEQAVLARWSSWGAIPQVFDDDNPEWADQRAQLRDVLTDEQFAAARLTTINAHYTHAAYVEAMWQAARDLGFDGGAVLEPGSGSGTFIGLAPSTAQMTGIELDPVTAAIARGLYPHADIRTESFADTRFPRDHFDAVIGNVPFANVALYDPQFNGAGHSMHNHFIVKSLAMTRPGGIAVVLSSSFTMDAVYPAARREMNSMADLVGAIRLPTGAHRRAAGTDALTDLLIFRRRDPGTPPADPTWETVSAHRIDGHLIKTNAYFDIHPDHVLGTIRVGQGMYGDATVHVETDALADVPARLQEALSDVVRRAREQGQVWAPATEASRELRAQRAQAHTSLWDGTIIAGERDTFQIAHAGQLHDYPVPRAQAAELRALLQLRDGARALLNAEDTSLDDSPALEEQRASLRQAYETYVDRFGALNRYTLRGTGRYETITDPVTGEVARDAETGDPVRGAELTARVTPPALVKFRQDPQSALVRALERFDEETQASTPAALLLQRVVVPRPLKLGAETPAEAVALSLDQTGGVELEVVSRLLGVDQPEARALLGDLVYDDPDTGELVHAPEYLSGDVRTKLEQAEAAAAADPRFAVNVDALRAVIPDPIGIDQIEARLGSVWISPEIHQQFLSEILHDRTVRVENPLPGAWDVRGQRYGLRATNEWGTTRRPATDIAQAVMEQRRIEVTDEVEGPDGGIRRVINPVETTAAQEKAEALQERFSQWVWEDPARAGHLGEIYNRRFNAIRLRDYTQSGDHLTLSGLTATLTLRPHQRAAVARMIAEPTTGLFHQVGAGKTLEMIVGASEMRRMGLITKPAIVVPNHMLEQFSREWLQAYPQARILAASTDDLAGDKRRLFVARAAANDWDAIILTQTAFKKIGLSSEFEQRYIQSELEQLRSALELAKEEGAMSVKRIEKRVLAVGERYKRALAMTRDPGISFEDTGIDYLVVDEAHMYKNLATISNIQDAAIEGSQQATDLHMKLEYLRERHGDRVATMATATPLANSITEAYVMQRYLRPDLLEKAGVTSFDGWAATFGSQVTEMEMGPAGGFRLKTRFARFQNVPEMLRMWHVFADVKTGEDLNLPVPQIAARASDGKREIETVVLQPTPELQEYIAAIAERAERVASRQVDSREDNMLLISTDGRKAALDLRLVDERAHQSGPVKLDAVAARILTHWQQNRHREYLDETTGTPSPIRGSLQLVFSDLGTPNERRWDAYTELRAKLIAGGMPPDSIRFIHEARDDKAKGRLFAAARAGHVAVLIGSTSKMGVGTNVQNRLSAMHHIDCPWRPADLEQRDGRGIRQGNQNHEVALFRYVVERSFDGYSWQTVARKATFIAQVMRGRLDVREIEDIGDTALSAAEAKALASGNPLVLAKATADAALEKLRRQETAYHRAQSVAQHTRTQAQAHEASAIHDIHLLRAAHTRTVDIAGDAFQMHIGGRTYTSRADAAAAITEWARAHHPDIAQASGRELTLGRLAGHDVVVAFERDTGPDFRPLTVARVFLGPQVPLSGSRQPAADLLDADHGTIRAIENKTSAIPRNIARREQDLVAARKTIAEADTALSRPFPHTDALKQATARTRDIDDALAKANEVPPGPAAQQRSIPPASRPTGPVVTAEQGRGPTLHR